MFDNIEDYWDSDDYNYNSYEEEHKDATDIGVPDYYANIDDIDGDHNTVIATPTISASLQNGELVFVCETSTILTGETRY